ncbi:MAG: crossover junction endodeoxyribonuclease RuvC [Gammaproteobacteria bacterium]|nr:crossover junction endodeoxyribonuclease RuvC [Gammaproteobacteria bacterium]
MPSPRVLPVSGSANTAGAGRVLGIDPGSRVTGFGVLESDARGVSYVEHGSVRLADGGLCDRLGAIYTKLGAVIDRCRPDVVVIEKVFMARNAQSALVLGQARGAAVVAAVDRGVAVVEYSALEVKQAVVGRGRADKRQVQHMVRALLGLTKAPAADAADALACAICHAHHVAGAVRFERGLAPGGTPR